MPAMNAGRFTQTDPPRPGQIAVTIQGVSKSVPAVRDETGVIVASIPARFVDPMPPFPPFRRLTLLLLPSGHEIAYLHDPEGTDEQTHVSLDRVHWSADAALLPNAD